MKNKTSFSLVFFFTLLLPLSSCSNAYTGKIIFELEGGNFTDESFSTNYLVGEAGTPVKQEIPNPVKEGHFFVGWREKKKDGSYRVINKKLSEENGQSYYYYPYGSDTFYAYFEPLVTIQFELGEEGKDCKLVAPKYESENFSGNTLSGYASKELASVDYLPSVDVLSSHLNFQYWYSKYPLSSSKDENNTTHYQLDTTKEEGIYQFDTAFKNGMEFLLDKTITLYAYYIPDPTITIHFNIDGMEDYSFQGKDSIEDELTSILKTNLGIDYSMISDAYYYPSDTKKKRFKGFYKNKELTQFFSLDSTISTSNLDLYIKWDNRIKITLDYQGGKVGSKESEVIDTYYSDDVLGNEFLKAHTPTKENHSLKYFTLDDKEFNFKSDKLPREDITLAAVYDEYPTLNLHYDFPDNYTREEYPDEEYIFEPKKDFSATLAAFKNKVNDESLCFSSFYTYDSSNKQVDLSDTEMPKTNLDVYVKFDYRSKAIIHTYINTSSTYSEEETLSLEAYFDQGNLTEKDFSTLRDSYTKENDVYLYDGLFSDSSLTKKTSFPFSLESNHVNINTLDLYRKMTKSIVLTFFYEGETESNKKLHVLPNGKLDDYLDEIKNLIGNYTSLTLSDGSILSNLLPGEDTNVYVKGHTTASE